MTQYDLPGLTVESISFEQPRQKSIKLCASSSETVGDLFFFLNFVRW